MLTPWESEPEAQLPKGDWREAGQQARHKSKVLRAMEARRLHHVEKWPSRAIAAHLRVSPKTVWTYLNVDDDITDAVLRGRIPAEPVPLAEVVKNHPDVRPCLEDTPEGFKAFFERFSPYKPGARIERRICEGLA